MVVLYLLLLALPTNNDAFSSVAPLMAQRGRMSISPFHAATLENADAPEPFFLSLSSTSDAMNMMPELNPAAIAPSESLDLDRDTIINSSIILLAVGIVLERILSVDVGITQGLTPTEIAEGILLENWRSYTNILNMAPLQTKAVTSATVYAIGDILAQNKEGNDNIGSIDRWRVFRSLMAGLIGHGPMSHVWYDVSEDFFDNVLNLHAWWDFIPKVVVDQTLFGPIWNNSYILLLGMMQLQKPSQIFHDMKRTTIPLIVSGLKLWPFVHCITYGLIPVENRLLWVDAVEILWVTILAGEAAGSSEEEGDDGMTVGNDEATVMSRENASLR